MDDFCSTDELNLQCVPLDAIAKGRDMGEVLSSYMKFCNDAKAVAATCEKSDDEILADAIMAATYRIYLLGVEDGMKGDTK